MTDPEVFKAFMDAAFPPGPDQPVCNLTTVEIEAAIDASLAGQAVPVQFNQKAGADQVAALASVVSEVKNPVIPVESDVPSDLSRIASLEARVTALEKTSPQGGIKSVG